MTTNQAKTKVAQHLLALGVSRDQIHAVIDMTKESAIIETANLLTIKELSLDETKLFVYWPEIN